MNVALAHIPVASSFGFAFIYQPAWSPLHQNRYLILLKPQWALSATKFRSARLQAHHRKDR